MKIEPVYIEDRIEVCQGPECREYGGPELLHDLCDLGLPAVLGHCQGLCHFAPIVHINKKCFAEAKLKDVVTHFES
ncbi:MAG: (2Fe-2S) ferredoxin domain-containing protein [Mariprofundus sp.]|nr:(2Fe-2S) ferredoxin domain-containing protein [Mariprofundus sp.]